MWRLFKRHIPGSHPNSVWCVCGGGQKVINCISTQAKTAQLPDDLSLTTLLFTLESEKPSEAIHSDPSFYEWDTGPLELAMESWSVSVPESEPVISASQYRDALLQSTGDDSSTYLIQLTSWNFERILTIIEIKFHIMNVFNYCWNCKSLW